MKSRFYFEQGVAASCHSECQLQVWGELMENYLPPQGPSFFGSSPDCRQIQQFKFKSRCVSHLHRLVGWISMGTFRGRYDNHTLYHIIHKEVATHRHGCLHIACRLLQFKTPRPIGRVHEFSYSRHTMDYDLTSVFDAIDRALLNRLEDVRSPTILRLLVLCIHSPPTSNHPGSDMIVSQ